ncbi:MAG: ATP-dependent RNA helicase DeaD [Candidatus Promineifilaceae bacterium]|jgi:ATP-dependent RNA helicase DeaD
MFLQEEGRFGCAHHSSCAEHKPPDPYMTFDDLGLSPQILEAIKKMGFETPTPVQAKVIPHLLENEGDIVALAQTGTGKTAAFGLPILNMLTHEKRSPQALILCPTRELCVQIARDITAYAACSPAVRIVSVYGGAAIQPQLAALNRGAHIIVATPGRMLDILRRRKADLSGVQRVVLDEADEMLNMGFKEDLESILKEVPDHANTLLFSATMPKSVSNIARNYMDNPKEITVGQRNAGAETVSHDCYIVHERDRYPALKRIADIYPDTYAIVFCRTRIDTQRIADKLIKDGYNADSLHGDLSQAQRDSVMGKFRTKHLQLLIATDVAARGLDVTDLTHVINYNLPDDLASYTHRSGRTGRAGKSGVSVLLINMREKSKAHRIEKMIGKTFTYRKVPSGQQVCEAQFLSMIDRMKSVEIDHDQIEPFLPVVYDALEGMDWKDVVKRFVSLEFNNLLDYYRKAEDLNPNDRGSSRHDERSKHEKGPSRHDKGPKHDGERPERKSSERRRKTKRLSISLGKTEGMNPKKLVGFLNHESGGGVTVGRIEILKKFSIFEVGEGDVDNLLLTVGMSNYQGREIRLEPVEGDFEPQTDERPARRHPSGDSGRSGSGGPKKTSYGGEKKGYQGKRGGPGKPSYKKRTPSA